MEQYATKSPCRKAVLEKAGRRWNPMKRSVLGAALVAALCALPASSALAAFSDYQTGGDNTDHFYGNTLITSAGTFNNSSALTFNTSTLPGNTGALFAWDLTPSVDRSGDYYYGTGVAFDVGSGTVAINNNSGGTMQGIVTGYGQAFGVGVYDISAGGVTINNSGTMDGEVWNNDGTAAAVYVSGGPASVTNNAGATMSATAPYYAGGIYANGGGPQTIVNNGTIKVTATGGTQGNNANAAYGAGFDVFTWAPDGSSPIYVVNNGTVSVTGACSQFNNLSVAQIWAEGSSMTYINNGTMIASGNGTQGGISGCYCGADNGDVTLYNNGTITNGGGDGGQGVWLEIDSAVGDVHFSNTGTIVSAQPFAICIANYSGGSCGNAYVTNTGTISGNWLDLHSWNGNIIFCDSGDIHASWYMGGGNNQVYISGLPTIDPTIDGGSGGNNTLVFNLTGTLQQINGNAASGNTLSGLGSSGSIVVSGKTYSWNNFASVSGTVSTAPTPTPTAVGGTYKLLARHSGKALDAYGAGTANGTQIIQWTYGAAANQQWSISSVGNNLYSIIGVGSGKCVDINGAGTANGTKVQLWDYQGGSNQKFAFNPTTNGCYEISPSHATGSCLDVNGVSTSDGATVQLWTYGGGQNQQWLVQPVDGTVKLISQLSSKALDAYGAGTANGTQLIQWTYGGGSNQKWTLTDTGSGNYKIIGVQSGKAVDIYNGGTANGSKVRSCGPTVAARCNCSS